jgi:hypothetical protein
MQGCFPKQFIALNSMKMPRLLMASMPTEDSPTPLLETNCQTWVTVFSFRLITRCRGLLVSGVDPGMLRK